MTGRSNSSGLDGIGIDRNSLAQLHVVGAEKMKQLTIRMSVGSHPGNDLLPHIAFIVAEPMFFIHLDRKKIIIVIAPIACSTGLDTPGLGGLPANGLASGLRDKISQPPPHPYQLNGRYPELVAGGFAGADAIDAHLSRLD